MGHRLILQVFETLRYEHPKIKQFVTLSPVPGFSRWFFDNPAIDKEENETYYLKFVK